RPGEAKIGRRQRGKRRGHYPSVTADRGGNDTRGPAGPRAIRCAVSRLVSPGLRGEADDLDAGAPRDVHRLDDFLVLPVGRGLDEQELRRPGVEDRMDLHVELAL